MKNLLLHAKYIAKLQDEDIIDLDHIRLAIKNMNLGLNQIKIDILDYFNDKFNFYAEEISIDEDNIDKLIDGKEYVDIDIVEEASKIQKINFSYDVKQFLKIMKQKGYDIKGNLIPDNTYVEGFDILKQVKEMKRNLSQKIYGQDRAIEVITDSIKNNILANENEPKQTYIFLGPPATGKTYLAELLGDNLKEYQIKKFDMTQYTHEDSGGNLYGTGRMWGNTKPGLLTSFVRKNPKSIIILDEFEKANNSVQTNLLSIFEGGFMIDACGWSKKTKKAYNEGNLDENKVPEDDIDEIVDFRKTIFIITSNLGKELYNDHRFIDLINKDYLEAESMILDVLRREKRQDQTPSIVPELLSRFSKANIVLFNKLEYKAYEYIAINSFDEYRENFYKKYKLRIKKTTNFKDFIKIQLLSFSPEFDVRRIKSKIGINFFDKVTDYLIAEDKELNYCKEIRISISKQVNDFLKENINDKINQKNLIKDLFRKNNTLKINDKFTNKDRVITYKIVSCEFQKMRKIKDFSEDGLVFDIPNITFNDISGHIKAKQRLNEIIDFLKKPSLLKDFDIKVPKGMILFGPPGTGKTMLAKAFAHEANLPIITTTGVDLINIEKMKSIFSKAKEYSPSIIFIDEIDAIGSRENRNGTELIINKLLSEIDGFSNNPDENVFIIAATNYIQRIDNAILRPGRLELHVHIDFLDKNARLYFINKILATKPTSGKFDLDKLVMFTAELTGAQLEQIGRESALYCLRNNLETITQDILIEQINIVKYGERISHRSLEEIQESTAIHESGHAVILKVLIPHGKIEQVTIVPRKNSLGFISFSQEDMNINMTINDIKNQISISMAGRLSQIKKFGEHGMDSGASSDLEQATKLAYTAIAHLGMDEEIGYINISNSPKILNKEIDLAVQRWLKEIKDSTKVLIDTHWDKIETLSKLLLKQEVVYEKELEMIIKP